MRNRRHGATTENSRISITLMLWFLVGFLFVPSGLLAFTTGDGLTLGVTSEGRVNQLQLESQTIDFCDGLDGGFYIRDYTPDASGLPEARGSNNLLTNPDFETGLIVPWLWDGFGSSYLIEPASLQLNGSTTAVAKVSFLEDRPIPHDAWMYQDINIGPGTPFANPTEHELFCFAFDVATECGFRPKDDPAEYDPLGNGAVHRIEGNVWWYDSTPPALSMTPEEAAAAAIAKTDFEVTGTTNSIVSSDPDYVVMTSNGVRSYRPLEAIWVRVGVRVRGFIPNDGTNQNAVYFDNFAFYKAPPITPVKANGLLGGTSVVELKDLNGNSLSPRLDGWATITEVNQGTQHYLLVEGELCNQDLTVDRPRAIDLGFALPIEDEENVQDVEWWDDISHSEYIHDAEQLLPFRMAGEIDTRPDRYNEYAGYSKEVTRVRAESTQVSAYPFSAIDIHRGNDQFGLSYGDNLDSDCVNISHFGYRVLQPHRPGIPYTPFLGLYYVEFRIGIREEATGDNTTPFSFIIFRSDNTEWKETSSFREAAEEYQVDIFPGFFTRPTFSRSDDWLFGGGVLNPDYTKEYDEQTQLYYLDFDDDGFDLLPSDFGFRYMTKRYDAVLTPALYKQLIDHYAPLGVGAAVYNQPWRAGFHNITSLNMNSYYCGTSCGLVYNRDAFDPTDPSGLWKWGQTWTPIFSASKANHLTLPGEVDIFSDAIDDYNTVTHDREYYRYPVLLANLASPNGGNLVDAVISYIEAAYSGAGDATEYGLRGAEFNNVFSGMSSANQLDLTEDRFGAFTNYLGGTSPRRGILTYSINTLSPAIPQLAANVWFLEEVSNTLDAIDASAPFGDGTRQPPLEENQEDEVIMGNMMEKDYGGCKYGIMYADVEGFENNVATDYNSSKRAQNFRRTVARDKNMARLLNTYSCLENVLNMWDSTSGCDALDLIWGTDNYDGMRLQLVNEAAWMSLAWGFLPSITGYLPKWPTDQGLDDFVDAHVRGPFRDNTGVGLGYTNIFKELHLAGWRPITNAVATDGSSPVDLVVERFGDQATLGGDQCVYFTVLNNENLTTTLNDLVWPYDEGYPYCPDGYDCSAFPQTGCPTTFFEAREKEFYLDINEAYKFNLWDGNIECVQLVSNPVNSTICNWPQILAKKFVAGPASDDYSIRRIPQLPYPNGKIRIGGTWTIGGQQKRSIKDKVLMVFKLWLSKTVDNGAGERGESEETTDGSEESADRITGTYERYGQYWQTYDTAGYNGTVDAVRADSSGFALYKINVGRSGRHAVKIHFPRSQYGTVSARYEVFVLDFQEEPIGETDLGTPILTAVIDQSGRTTYSEFTDGEGFITIGSIDVNVPESPGVVTVVIKLSIPEEERSRRSAASELLISDAVSLERID